MKIAQPSQRLKKSLAAVVVLCVIGLTGYVVVQRSRPRADTPNTAPSSSQMTGLPTRPTQDKTTEQKQEHAVPAAHPRHITIPSINVSANVISVGLTADGAMAAPETAWDVGWYNQSALPGPSKGAVLLDGHVNNALNTPGVFFQLGTLKKGDAITLERGDGAILNYTILRVEQIPTKKVDMARMMQSAEAGKQGLNLISCGGAYDYAKRTFVDRVLVFAVEV